MSFSHLFFPSWRFFENSGSFIRVQFRNSVHPDLDRSTWLPVFPLESRAILKVLWNPKGNEALAVLNHAALFIQRLPSMNPDELENDSSFQVIKNYVECLVPNSTYFQFKFVANPSEDLVMSPIFQKEIP